MSQHISSMSFVEMSEAKIVEGALEEQYRNDASKNSYIKGAVKGLWLYTRAGQMDTTKSLT